MAGKRFYNSRENHQAKCCNITDEGTSIDEVSSRWYVQFPLSMNSTDFTSGIANKRDV